MDRRLEDLKRALESAVSGMSDQQLSWHPPEKWCAAEVLEHLYLTYTGTIRGFEKVLQADKPPAARPTRKQRWQTLVVVGFGYLPKGRKSPPMVLPRGLPATEVRGEMAERIESMDQIIGECEARFGRDAKLLDHPILGPLTARQWRKFHVVHGRLHEKQIRRLRKALPPSV